MGPRRVSEREGKLPQPIRALCLLRVSFAPGWVAEPVLQAEKQNSKAGDENGPKRSLHVHIQYTPPGFILYLL